MKRLASFSTGLLIMFKIMFLLEDIVQVRESKEYPYVNIGSHWEQLSTLFIQHKYTHTYIYFKLCYVFCVISALIHKVLKGPWK